MFEFYGKLNCGKDKNWLNIGNMNILAFIKFFYINNIYIENPSAIASVICSKVTILYYNIKLITASSLRSQFNIYSRANVKRVGWKNIFDFMFYVRHCFEYNNRKSLVIFCWLGAYSQFLRKYLWLLETSLENELVISSRIKCMHIAHRRTCILKNQCNNIDAEFQTLFISQLSLSLCVQAVRKHRSIDSIDKREPEP